MDRSLGIFLTAEKNFEKPKVGDDPMKAVRPVISSNEVPYRQITLLGLLSKPGKEEEERRKKDSMVIGALSFSLTY